MREWGWVKTAWIVLAVITTVLVIVGTLLAPAPVGGAVARFATRLLGELNLRVVLGLAVAFAAARLWSAALEPLKDLPASGSKLHFTRHWGGLGSGEGGWEVDARAVNLGLNLLAVLALSVTAVMLILPVLAAADEKPASAKAAGGEPADEPVDKVKEPADKEPADKEPAGATPPKQQTGADEKSADAGASAEASGAKDDHALQCVAPLEG